MAKFNAGDIVKGGKSIGYYSTEREFRITKKHPTKDAYYYEPVNFVGDKEDYIYEHQIGEIVERALKTENRHANAGERIVITDAKPLEHRGQSYSNGDILTVVEADAVAKGDVVVKGQPSFIDNKEYEVIVEKPVGSAKVKVGDKIRITDATCTFGNYRNGDVFTVKEVISDYVFVNETHIIIFDSEFEVIEKPKPTFKNGDKVVLLDVSRGGLLGFSEGGVYTVTNAEHPGHADVEIVNGIGIHGYTYNDNLKLATATATVKVGDHVKAVSKDGGDIGWGRSGQGLIRPGTVVKVTRVLHDGDVEVHIDEDNEGNISAHDGGNQSSFLLREGEFEVTTDTPKIKKVAVEFNVGDFVVVTEDNFEHREGDVLELKYEKEADSMFDFAIRNHTTGRQSGFIEKKYIRKATADEVRKAKAKFQPGDIVLAKKMGMLSYVEVISFEGGPMAGGNYRVDNGNGTYLVLGDNITMIAPKDNRVD